MSQEKVNKYKWEKANRKELMQKEKRNKMITRIAGAVVVLALIGWVGFSVYDSITDRINSSLTKIDLSETEDYLESLDAEELAAEQAEQLAESIQK